MSQSGSGASAEGQGEHQSGSVFDLLYYDARRAGTFLSQFNDAGFATRITQTEGVQKARGRGFKLGAGGGIAGLGNANLSLERGPAVKGAMEAEEREHNPYWVNAMALLDHLASREMLVRDLAEARVGQVVLIGGSLSIADMALFKALWATPVAKRAITQAQQKPAQPNRAERRRLGKQPQEATQSVSDGAEFASIVLSAVPHLVHVQLRTEAGEFVWGSLREDGMVGTTSDVTLKHGLVVAGRWNVLGILDALPEMDADGNVTASALEQHGMAQAFAGGALTQVLMELMLPLREALGRPLTAHGITPLLIFREISG